MPDNLLQQITEITTGKMNTVNDPVVGSTVGGPLGGSMRGGVLGNRVCLGPDNIKFDSVIGTLYGGIYQYVRFASGAAAAAARGLLAFWDTSVGENLYQVTMDEPAGVSLIAGIVLNAVSKGNYGWIQIVGRASVQFRATIGGTKAVGAVVAAAAQGAGADVATADTLTDASNVTAMLLKRVLGIAETLPADGAISIVRLKNFDLHI